MSDRTHWDGCHARHSECALARLAEAVAALHDIAHAEPEASALRLRFMAADALIAHNTASSAEPRESP